MTLAGLRPGEKLFEWLTDDLKAPRKQRHTAKRIYQRLQEEYPDQLEVKLRSKLSLKIQMKIIKAIYLL